ncbi:dihydrofolate reductase family protein [Corynebacterium variabile]|uniref:dihydrofolate reductase family protein n=1 Tax=Corynebacterium variabile TaxID=1727 RepID=UPI003FD24CA5
MNSSERVPVTGDALDKGDETVWGSPVADRRLSDDPAHADVQVESVRSAFLAALQALPPRQRVVLILRDVLAWSAAESAELLDSSVASVASVTSALARARTTLRRRQERGPSEGSTVDRRLLGDYVAAFSAYDVAAFSAYDVDRLIALLSEDARFSMPPYTLWPEGREDIEQWWYGPGQVCRDSAVSRPGSTINLPSPSSMTVTRSPCMSWVPGTGTSPRSPMSWTPGFSRISGWTDEFGSAVSSYPVTAFPPSIRKEGIMPRTTIARLFHTLIGVVEDPHLWQFDSFGEEDGLGTQTCLAPVNDVVIEATPWKEWSEYRPAQGPADPFAQWINPIRKHVISSTLPAELPWNSSLVTGDPVAYVRELRETGEGDIAVAGGITTVRTLFLAGLIDRLTFTTHPAVVGEGHRLFDGSVPITRLALLDNSRTSTGNMVLTYGLRESD